MKNLRLGELLKNLRGDEGLRDAAKRMEITYSYLALLEKGTDRRTGKPLKPTPETLQQIASAYKYDYIKLIEAAGYLYNPVYNPALKEPFAHNPSLQQWYKSLPGCNEKDIEKLKTIWEVIHEGGDN
ncbi:helix-turn-helix domain-containing protein [Lysinibacillus sphaericus]|uniref:helix-turn-helix domain-containing protein n=1 Tax=Lysinibacillus sphaericus TaxID=1421 RepID=UPI001A9DD402|nr:helix-turn-helix transcriptional regulator [Lysinibacillus sphaericus]QTB24289.1 helix-turn-helix domain-containing protein [Lysinibacillus sphaericus]